MVSRTALLAALLLVTLASAAPGADYDSVIAFRGTTTAQEGVKIYRPQKYFKVSPDNPKLLEIDEKQLNAEQKSNPLQYCLIGPYDAGKSLFGSKISGRELPTGSEFSTVGISFAISDTAIIYDFAGDGVIIGNAMEQQSVVTADNILTDTAALTPCAVVFVYTVLDHRARLKIHNDINRIVATRTKHSPELLKLPFYVIINNRNAEKADQLKISVSTNVPLHPTELKYPWYAKNIFAELTDENDRGIARASHHSHTYSLLNLDLEKITVKSFVLGNVNQPLGKALLAQVLLEMSSESSQSLVPTMLNPSVSKVENQILRALELAISNNANDQQIVTLDEFPVLNGVDREKLDMTKGASSESTTIFQSISDFFSVLKAHKKVDTGLYHALTWKPNATLGKLSSFGDVLHTTYTENGITHIQLFLPGCGPHESTIRTDVRGKDKLTYYECKSDSKHLCGLQHGKCEGEYTLPPHFTGFVRFPVPSRNVCPMLTTYYDGIVDIVVFTTSLASSHHKMCFGEEGWVNTLQNVFNIHKDIQVTKRSIDDKQLVYTYTRNYTKEAIVALALLLNFLGFAAFAIIIPASFVAHHNMDRIWQGDMGEFDLSRADASLIAVIALIVLLQVYKFGAKVIGQPANGAQANPAQGNAAPANPALGNGGQRNAVIAHGNAGALGNAQPAEAEDE